MRRDTTAEHCQLTAGILKKSSRTVNDRRVPNVRIFLEFCSRIVNGEHFPPWNCQFEAWRACSDSEPRLSFRIPELNSRNAPSNVDFDRAGCKNQYYSSQAQVAELADALGSGPSDLNGRGGSSPLLGIFLKHSRGSIDDSSFKYCDRRGFGQCKTIWNLQE